MPDVLVSGQVRIPTRRPLASEWVLVALSAAYFLVLATFTPGFASRGNLAALLTTMLPLALLAAGQTFVLLAGGIDLSAASVVALASVLGAQVMNLDSGWFRTSPLAVPLALGAMVAAGAIVGLLNGVAVVGLRMPPFIVTLTSMMFVSGLAIWFTKSRGIGHLPAGFNSLGGRLGFALPATLALLAGAHLLLSRTLFGRWLYAVGQNRATARVSGVPTAAVQIGAYVLSGGFAASASVLLTAQTETGSPVLGQRLLLDLIAATVIGGVSLFGGRGRLVGALAGVLFIKLLDNSLNLLGISYFALLMVKGAVILVAALVDTWRTPRTA